MKAPSVLERIAGSVRFRMEERKARRSEAALRALCEKARGPHDFRKAISGVAIPVIAEVKLASPSAGRIADESGSDPVEIARDYLRNGASALSVLTEQDHFQGNPEYLRRIREAFPQARLLMKDFVLEEYQLLEARLNGADAVLLIVALLGREKTKELLVSSRKLGLTALVEVHDESEMQVALELGAELIGVNNRNLKTLEISLETSQRLAKLASPGVCLISESGLSRREELLRLQELGFSGFLIGSSLMKTGAPGAALSRLIGPSPRIKICGITREEDARLAASLGAWALGFVFHPESPRSISPEGAAQIIKSLKLPELKTVGVFVNPSLEKMLSEVGKSGVNTVQLHGEETPEFCRKAREKLPEEIQLIKALRLKSRDEIPTVADFAPFCQAVLLDTYVPGARGGTGRVGNWEWASQAARYAPIILAGGLNPENIREAFGAATPFALDISSGLESAPGTKAPEKVRQLFLNMDCLKLERKF